MVLVGVLGMAALVPLGLLMVEAVTAHRWGMLLLATGLAGAVIALVRERAARLALAADHRELKAYHARTQSQAARDQGELRQEVARRATMEQELRTSREQMRLVLANAPLIISTLDPDGRLTLLEGRGLERLDLDVSGCIGQPLCALVGDESVLNDAVDQSLEGTAQWVTTELQGIPFEFHHRPLMDADGRITGVVGVGVDISERHQVEQLKREFMASVTHELRTPLTSILGALGLLAGGAMGDLSPSAQRLLDIARTNSDRLLGLVNDI
ncbi:MAG: histidine kinase dimerization/phospho-acceptor domain-containing protein, partial [Pseudomonadota bacterium]